MAVLEVQHIQKTFEKTQVLKDISFSMEKGRRYLLLDLLEAVRQHFCAA